MPARSQIAKSPDTEKLTINLGFVDLGHIDLLVRDGFYSNRSDFIRTAIRNELAAHADATRAVSGRVESGCSQRTGSVILGARRIGGGAGWGLYRWICASGWFGRFARKA